MIEKVQTQMADILETQNKLLEVVQTILSGSKDEIAKQNKLLNERSNVADRMMLALKWVIGFLVVLTVAMTIQQIIWLTPAIKNDPVEIREIGTGKLFEVVNQNT
jgi:type IV secretory pathway component VirB8